MFVKHFIGGLAATAVLQTAVCRIDCNPSLYINDWWFRHGRPTMESLLLVRTHRCIASSPPPSHHPFENQCIWIIGASSGIGEELAYQLVSPISHPRRQPKTYHHPIHLILSSRSVDRLQLVAATCQNYNRNSTITILPMDVTKDDDIYNAIQHLGTLTTTPANTTDSTHAVGGLALDTVVFNAGVGHLSPAIETSPTMIDKVWKQTARYPMIIIPLLLNRNNNTSNLWKHAARPHFVVTSSIAAMIPVPLSSVYGAAKAALWNYCRTLHSECPHLLLHTIMPGPVDTPFHQHHHNRPAMNHHVTNDAVSSTPPRQSAQSPMKMTVQRCVQLMISTMRLSYSTESWLVPSSSSSPLSMLLLVGLYWHKLLPIAFLQSMVYSRIGLKRIRMWRKGYDLYDPKSWRS